MNPWEIFIDDARTEDTMATFIIFCEDSTDEPYYFRSFEVPKKLKINAIGNQKFGRLNLDNTIAHCEKDGLLDCLDNKYHVKKGQEIWCVYDRDLESEDITNIDLKNDVAFTSAIQAGEAAGLKIAWSNDSFELWILLHFETVPVGTRVHRNYIYDRLTTIFKKIQFENYACVQRISHFKFGYKLFLKHRLHFLSCVLPIIKPLTGTALENAQFLESQFPHHTPYHHCNPSTKIHHLVKALIEASSS